MEEKEGKWERQWEIYREEEGSGAGKRKIERVGEGEGGKRGGGGIREREMWF